MSGAQAVPKGALEVHGSMTVVSKTKNQPLRPPTAHLIPIRVIPATNHKFPNKSLGADDDGIGVCVSVCLCVFIQAVCELHPCPEGVASVTVGGETEADVAMRQNLLKEEASLPAGSNATTATQPPAERMLRLVWGDSAAAAAAAARPTSQHGPRQHQHEEDEEEDRMQSRKRRRRRLVDIEEVVFTLPTEGGTADAADGGVTTQSQQAAAFFNNMADTVRGKDTTTTTTTTTSTQ